MIRNDIYNSNTSHFRLFINISQAYIPLYVQHTLNMNPVNIAVIPLIMFISGFFVSLINKPLAKLIGRKSSMIIGCLIGLVGAVWVQFGSKDWYSFTTYQVLSIYIQFYSLDFLLPPCPL